VFTARIRHQRRRDPDGSQLCQSRVADDRSVRLVLEPKAGLPTDPNDPGAFIDIFTDISGCSSSTTSRAGTGWMITTSSFPIRPTAARRHAH
jgi:hypothetical protein